MSKKVGNAFATNQGGVIKALKPTAKGPKATVVKGSDLRDGSDAKNRKK